MNKKIFNTLILIAIFILITYIFKGYSLFPSITINISTIFLTKVFPFLFIMMVLNNLLINLNFPYYLSHIIKSPYIYTMILSIMSGSPLNAIIINDFLDNKTINEKDASIILTFTSFNNPLFLYSYFNLIFNDKIIIIKLFIIIYLSNFIIYFIFKNKLSHNNYNIAYKPINISKSITTSIRKSSENIINIFCTIFFFYLITTITIQTNSLVATLCKGLIEITQGLNALTNINLSLKTKELLTIAILQFQGLSIHVQISSVLNKHNINYKYFYISRFLLILISLGLKMRM